MLNIDSVFGTSPIDIINNDYNYCLPYILLKIKK